MTVSRWSGSLLGGVVELLFPPVCVACRLPTRPDAAERLICAVCWSRSEALPAPRCERCWSPVLTGGVRSCDTCRALPPALRCVRSAFRMTGPVREMTHALKYAGWEAVADPLARRMAALALPSDVQEEAALVVPVPAAAARLRERGYNQAERLAASFARRTGRGCAPELLVRTRGGGTQTALHPAERRANVAAAFAVPPSQRGGVRGRHLLLVDDVWTTGATAEACTGALVEAGARAVSVVTFARALPELER